MKKLAFFLFASVAAYGQIISGGSGGGGGSIPGQVVIKAANGVNDDVQLQAAINAMATSGGRIEIPCGNYRLTDGVGLSIAGKYGYVIESVGTSSYGSTTNQCTRILASNVAAAISVGDGTNRYAGGVIRGITVVDVGAAGAGQTVTDGFYISDSATTLDRDEVDNAVTGFHYDGGAFFQNDNRLRDWTTRNVHVCESVTGDSDGPSPSEGGYCTMNGSTANNVGIDINSSGTATSFKSLGDNLVTGAAGTSSGAITSAARSGTTTVTITTTAPLPAAFISNGYGTISGCNVADYNVTNALITVTGASTFTYLAATSATDTATGCNPVTNTYAVGIRSNATDNHISAVKIELQPSCCLGSGIELLSAGTRLYATGNITKSVNPVLFDASSGSFGGALTLLNNTNNFVDNGTNGVSGGWFFDVIASTSSYRQFPGDSRFLGGTGFPPSGMCKNGGIYLRSNNVNYGCTSSATWTPIVTGATALNAVPLGAGSGVPMVSSNLSQDGTTGQLVGSKSINGPAPTPIAFSATPTFDLSTCSRCEMAAMTANVTSVTFTNLKPGLRFSLTFLQDAPGGRTVAGYTVAGGSVVNACAVSPTSNARTTCTYEVASDGVTIRGTTPGDSDETPSIMHLTERAAGGTPGTGTADCWPDSTDHTGLECKANGSTSVFKLVLTGIDLATTTGQVTSTHITGGTNGFVPKFNATGNLVPTLCDEGITTANTVTCTDTSGLVAPKFVSSGTTAGFVDYPQGTTSSAVSPCNAATSICEQAPTSVTSYLVNKPGVSATGIITNNVSAAVITQGFSGDANHSATVTTGSGTSIGSTSLCSTANCPVGTYQINAYIDITTACTTGGTYIVNLIYTDDQGAKTVPINIQGTGTTPTTGSLALNAVGNFGHAAQTIRSTGAASINYSTTAGACGTGGPMVGKLYLAVVPVM